MTWVFVLLAIAAAVGIVVWAVRARSRRQQASTPPSDPFAPEQLPQGDPRALKAGDMIEYLGERLFVRGSLRLREGGYQWSEHFIDDVAGDKRWVSVEEDPDLEVIMWKELKGTGLTPSTRELTVEGIEYHREEHGTAQFASEGTTGLNATGTVEYADFTASKGRHLSFERFDGGAWEVAVGERVPAGTLTIYPGGDGQ